MGKVHRAADNMSAKDAYRNLNIVSKEREKSQEKLSSGYRINRGADDAAGLTISEKMRKFIRGLDRGNRNVEEGVSLLQVADGALEEVSFLIKRMNELAIQSANGTNSDDDRKAMDDEVQQLKNEVDRIMDTTTYNDIHIFKGEERETIANFVSEREHEVNDTISLVKSLSGDIGYFAESWNNHLAAIADFSDINSSNISKLYDKTFSFVCHLGCGETFQFTLQNSTTDSATGRNSSSSHHYYIGIANATNGSDLVTSVMNCIQTYPVSGYGTDNRYNLGGQCIFRPS